MYCVFCKCQQPSHFTWFYHIFQIVASLDGTLGYIVLACARLARRSNNFIVGLTNVSPLISEPTLWNYTVCGQYPGAVPSGATVSLYCQENLPPFRYVIVQFPLTNNLMNVCEIEVLVIGMKMTSVLKFTIIYKFVIFFRKITCADSLELATC